MGRCLYCMCISHDRIVAMRIVEKKKRKYKLDFTYTVQDSTLRLSKENDRKRIMIIVII